MANCNQCVSKGVCSDAPVVCNGFSEKKVAGGFDIFALKTKEETFRDNRLNSDSWRKLDESIGKKDDQGKLGSSLDEAKGIICGERQDQYGNPEDSFEIIARYWNVFLWAKLKDHGVDIPNLLTPLDTTNMQILFKQARKLGQKPKRDNYVDSCGYEAIGADRLMDKAK